LKKYRKENGIIEMPKDALSDTPILSESELKISYTKLLQEFEKLKSKEDHLADAVYRAVKEDIESNKIAPVPKPKLAKLSTKKNEEVAVAVLADWQLCKVTPDYNSTVCEGRIDQFAEKVIHLTEIQRQDTKKNEEVAVAVLADWQLCKVTPDYNSTVCEGRIDQFAEKVIHLTEIQRQDHPVKDLHIWCLGDIIEGELIFPGQSFLVDGGLYRQITVDGPRIMKKFITKMLENFENITFVGVIGNHGAIGGRGRRDHDPETNGDRMLYRIVQLMFESEKRIKFVIPDGLFGNYTSLLIHGDQFGSLSTFYSFQKKVYGWKVGAIPEHFDDVYFGHFHTPTKMTFNTVQCRISGSPESTNTYAMESLAAVGAEPLSL